jgi:hypothetical protein
MAEETSKELTAAPARRVGPLQFLSGSAARDLQGDSGPSWQETYLTTIMVFIMVDDFHGVLRRSSTIRSGLRSISCLGLG